MNNKKMIKNNNLLLVFSIVIIIILFFYFNFKIETSNILNYKDSITGEIVENVSGKTICYIIFAILSIYTVLIISFIEEKMRKEEIKIENIFLCIVPIFCILLMFAIPMSKGHDETIHGLRIYEYAEGKFISNGEKAYLEEGVITALDNKDQYADIFNKENEYSTDTKTIEWAIV